TLVVAAGAPTKIVMPKMAIVRVLARPTWRSNHSLQNVALMLPTAIESSRKPNWVSVRPGVDPAPTAYSTSTAPDADEVRLATPTITAIARSSGRDSRNLAPSAMSARIDARDSGRAGRNEPRIASSATIA